MHAPARSMEQTPSRGLEKLISLGFQSLNVMINLSPALCVVTSSGCMQIKWMGSGGGWNLPGSENAIKELGSARSDGKE